MRVFWFVYTAFMGAPALLVAWIYYKISKYGSCAFNEPDLLVRNTETVCAFMLASLAVAGWIIATRLLFKRR